MMYSSQGTRSRSVFPYFFHNLVKHRMEYEFRETANTINLLFYKLFYATHILVLRLQVKLETNTLWYPTPINDFHLLLTDVSLNKPKNSFRPKFDSGYYSYFVYYVPKEAQSSS